MRAKRSTSRDNSINLKFRAHGKDFHIRLKRDTSTFSDNLIVEGPSGDIEEVDVSNQYSGSIVGMYYLILQNIQLFSYYLFQVILYFYIQNNDIKKHHDYCKTLHIVKFNIFIFILSWYMKI